MDFMLGVDVSPRLTASILTVAIVVAGGLFVLRRRRREDKWITGSCDGLIEGNKDLSPTSKGKFLQSPAHFLVTDFASGKLDGNIQLLVDKLCKKQISNQDAAVMMDLINRNQAKKNKTNKKKGKNKGEEKESEKERKLKAVIEMLENENKNLKESALGLESKNDGWQDQIKILHVQLAAVSKYAAKLRHLLETKYTSEKVDSFLNNSKTFQSKIEIHYDAQKIKATPN